MKGVVIGCLGVLAIIAVIVVAVVCFWLFVELPMLSAGLSLPQQATLDSTISMVVTATNSHAKPVVLDSIDIDDGLLEAFQVVSISPPGTDTMHIQGQRSWSFGKQVDPGESLAVRFELRALQEGHFSGNVDVCNPNQDFTSLFADIVVRK